MNPAQHFNAFQKEFDRCLLLLGVADYLVDYTLEDTLEDAVANVTTDVKNRRVFVALARDSVSEYSLSHTRTIAAHEAAHVLLAPLVDLIPDKVYEIELEESICNRLAKLLRKTKHVNIN